MSKITQANKKVKGKQAKIAASKKAKKLAAETSEAVVKTSDISHPNIGCCCTCKNYPKHFHGSAQPCRVSGKYVARKAQHPECYNCKY